MSKKLIAGAGVVASFAVALAPLATFATNSYYPNTHQDKLSVTIEEVCSFGHTYADGTVVNPGSHTNGTAINGQSGTESDTPESGINAGKSYGVWYGASEGVDNSDPADGDYDDEGDIAPGTPVTTDVASAYDTRSGSGTQQDPYVPTPAPVTPLVTDTAYGVMETNTVNNTFAKTTLAIICNTDSGYQVKAVTTDLVKEYTGDTPAATDKIVYDGDHAMVMPDSGTLASGWNFFVTDTTETADTVITDSTVNGTAGLSAHGASYTASPATITNNKSSYATDFTSGNVLFASSTATSTLGDRMTATYGVAVSPTQEAGTYEGTITYTLIQM